MVKLKDLEADVVGCCLSLFSCASEKKRVVVRLQTSQFLPLAIVFRPPPCLCNLFACMFIHSSEFLPCISLWATR